MDPHIFSEFITSIGCRLLEFQGLEDNETLEPTDQACHAGMATFLSTLYIQSGGRRYMKYALISTITKDAVEKCSGLDDNDLLIWLLFLAGPSVLAALERELLLSKVRQELENSGALGWVDVHLRVSSLPWINALHDAPAKRLYDEVCTFV